MTVRIRPKDVWDFYMGNMYRLRYEDYVLAEAVGGVSVVICVDAAYDLVVMAQFNGKTYSISRPTTPKECEEIVQKLYDKYEISEDLEEQVEADEEDESVIAEQDEVFEREDQLKLAFYDFMVAVVEDEDLIYDGGFDEQISEIMEETLVNIAAYGFPIRRPTYMEDDDGEEKLVDYPYEQ